MERKFYYSSQHLGIVFSTLKTALESNQDSQEKCLIPGPKHGKNMNIKNSFVCVGKRYLNNDDGDMSKEYRSHLKKEILGQIRENLTMK